MKFVRGDNLVQGKETWYKKGQEVAFMGDETIGIRK